MILTIFTNFSLIIYLALKASLRDALQNIECAVKELKTNSKYLIWSSDGVEFHSKSGSLQLYSQMFATNDRDMFLGAATSVKTHMINKFIVETLENEGLDWARTGDLKYIRNWNKEMGDLTSTLAYVYNQLHNKKISGIFFNGECTRMKKNFMVEAVAAYPIFSAGNTYDTNSRLKTWIENSSKYDQYYEHKMSNGDFKDGFGDVLQKFIEMSPQLLEIGKENPKKSKDDKDVIKDLSNFFEKNKFSIESVNWQVLQSIKIINETPAIMKGFIEKYPDFDCKLFRSDRIEVANKYIKNINSIHLKAEDHSMEPEEFFKSDHFIKKLFSQNLIKSAENPNIFCEIDKIDGRPYNRKGKRVIDINDEDYQNESRKVKKNPKRNAKKVFSKLKFFNK